MKQYLLGVQIVEGQEPPEPIEQLYKDVDVLNEEIKAAGAWVFAGGLHPSTTATVVRLQGDEVLTTDGPFAETKEQLGGYHMVECQDLDEALAIAARIPTLRVGGAVEVRPVLPLSER